jgi:hypothetical protein
LVFAFLILTVKNDWVNKEIDYMKQCFFDYTYSRGFALQKVNITGLVRQNKKQLTEALELSGEDNILEIDVAKLKQNIQNLIWVDTVEVNKTFFPNELNVKIKERDVLAIWQNEDKFWPVDTKGNVVKDENYIPSKFDLVIGGAKAPENLLSFMEIITKDNEVFNKIAALNFVSERRWNVIFDEYNNNILLNLSSICKNFFDYSCISAEISSVFSVSETTASVSASSASSSTLTETAVMSFSPSVTFITRTPFEGLAQRRMPFSPPIGIRMMMPSVEISIRSSDGSTTSTVATSP